MAQSDATTTAAMPAGPRDAGASRRLVLPRRAVLTAAAAAAMIGRPAFAEEKQLVLGCSLPLSGPAAPTEITTERTIEHALELINAKGITIGPDRYTIKAVFYDNKYVPAEAVTIVEKMLADGVRYLYCSGSGNSVPVVEKTTALKCIQLSGASGKDHLTAPKFPYSFRVQPTNETAYAVYPWLKTAYPAVKRVSNMGPATRPGSPSSEDRRMIAAKNGFINGSSEFFKRGALDFYPVATRLVGDKPDLIDLGGTIGRDQGLAVKALREPRLQGLHPARLRRCEILRGYRRAGRRRGHADVRHPGRAAERRGAGVQRLVAEAIRATDAVLRLSHV